MAASTATADDAPRLHDRALAVVLATLVLVSWVGQFVAQLLEELLARTEPPPAGTPQPAATGATARETGR